MTYEESYRKCTTSEELQKEVNRDIATAIMIGSTDRLDNIKKIANKVAKEKFNMKANFNF